MKHTIAPILLATIFATALPACVPADDDANKAENNTTQQYDEQQLNTYRQALPSSSRLSAPAPESSGKKVGDPAMYPIAAYGPVTAINGAVKNMVDILKLVVSVPPTAYNSQTKEFFWGPFKNDDGFGYTAAYIKEAGEGADFKYHYALLRGPDQDVTKLKPVIWGGSTPDAADADRGIGVTLWDFEANYEFEKANNPDFATMQLDRGRFVAMYGRGADKNDSAAEFAFTVAVFRNFVPKDKPMQDPADLDYFYGVWEKGQQKLNFLDFEFQMDVSEPKDGTLEDVGVRIAFTADKVGRAEADASGGSLATGQTFKATECWDASVHQTFLKAASETNGAQDWTVEDGDVMGCGGPFQSSFADLKIPSLQDVDAGLMATLSDVATNGIK